MVEDLCVYILNRVRKNGDCWEWQSTMDNHGYGMINISKWHNEFKKRKAHQLSFIAFIGVYERDLLVLHKCHNRACVNPYHLKLGTHQDNMNDRAEAGRNYRVTGSKTSASKFTDDDIRWIRANSDKFPTKYFAKKFNVANNTIRMIIRGKTYPDVR